jgi:hypothetical protein
MHSERRSRTRVRFETLVVVRTDETEITARAGSRDVSLQGLYVNTDERLPRDTPCEVEIQLTGSSVLLSIRAQGRVARSDAGGLGIEFESFDPDSYFHLRNLVMYNSEDPETVEQEERFRAASAESLN